jgi:hypothetical protein
MILPKRLEWSGEGGGGGVKAISVGSVAGTGYY